MLSSPVAHLLQHMGLIRSYRKSHIFNIWEPRQGAGLAILPFIVAKWQKWAFCFGNEPRWPTYKTAKPAPHRDRFEYLWKKCHEGELSIPPIILPKQFQAKEQCCQILGQKAVLPDFWAKKWCCRSDFGVPDKTNLILKSRGKKQKYQVQFFHQRTFSECRKALNWLPEVGYLYLWKLSHRL